MSIGTLYGIGPTRAILPVGLAKVFGLDVENVESKNGNHLADFPSGLVPAFKGQHGFKISEAIAVNYYCMLLLGPVLSEHALHDENIFFKQLSLS